MELIKEQQKEFEAAHPEWNITWNTAFVGEDVASYEVLKDIIVSEWLYVKRKNTYS